MTLKVMVPSVTFSTVKSGEKKGVLNDTVDTILYPQEKHIVIIIQDINTFTNRDCM